MSESIEKVCKRLAVRIALDSGQTLIGSGNVLACEMMGYALIFTAAHVMNDIDVEKPVHFCFENADGKQETIELNLKRKEKWCMLPDTSTGYIYVHPGYKPCYEPYPVYDGAIICVPYYSWMSNMPSFEICKCDDAEAMLVGFSRGNDTVIQNESDLEFTTYRDNIYSEKVKVLPQSGKNLVIHMLQRNINPFLDIDYSLDGLSGGGILTKSVQGLQFHGVFASDKNREQHSFYAPSSEVFLEIIKFYNIRVQLPHNINAFLDRAIMFFEPYSNRKALEWLKRNVNDYIPNEQIDVFFSDEFNDSHFLSCDSHRPLCPFYYSNKLIVKVLIGKVYSLKPERINNQTISIGAEKEEIHIEHICSESSIRRIATDLLRSGAVSEKGLFCNSTIFIVSDRNIERQNKDEVTRKQCSNIVASIVNNDNLYDEHTWDCPIGFSITYGDPRSINIGFLGIGRLEEKMCQAECQETMYSSIKELISNVWGA